MNRSAAVMQQRHEAHDSLDDFPTPPWATRALCEFLIEQGPSPEYLAASTVLEPACNRGHMAKPLGEYFGRVRATDVHDYGWGGQDAVLDFLIDWGSPALAPDWVITNPPFRLAEQFIDRALECARVGVAVFVRSAFAEGVGRYKRLFRDRPETFFLPFTERVILWKGLCLDPDVPVYRPDTGRLEKPSSATAYAWFVWIKDGPTGLMRRIPPCRSRLQRPGDYPPLPNHLKAPASGGAGLL